METILIIAGILAGGFAGHKFGLKRGLDRSFVIVDEDSIDQLNETLADARKSQPEVKEWFIQMDRKGFDVFDATEDE